MHCLQLQKSPFENVFLNLLANSAGCIMRLYKTNVSNAPEEETIPSWQSKNTWSLFKLDCMNLLSALDNGWPNKETVIGT